MSCHTYITSACEFAQLENVENFAKGCLKMCILWFLAYADQNEKTIMVCFVLAGPDADWSWCGCESHGPRRSGRRGGCVQSALCHSLLLRSALAAPEGIRVARAPRHNLHNAG